MEGQDYEFDVEVGGLPVAIEAKACDPRPNSDFRPTTVTNLLQKAARQLPKSGPSVIFVGVLWPHGGDPDVRRRAAEAADGWLRNHARVNRVYLEFEDASLMHPEGCVIAYRQAVIDNPGARAPMDLDSLGRGAKIGNDPIYYEWVE